MLYHSLDEHLERMGVMLRLLQQQGLMLKPSERHISRLSVKDLGFVISDEGINADPEKIRAIQEWPTSSNAKDVRAFVAFCGFYQMFVAGFAKLSAPLQGLMGGQSGQDVTMYWGDAEVHAFLQLKEQLTQAPVLGTAAYVKPFLVETDASFKGLGAVLFQEYNGQLYPVAYTSTGLREAERKMSTYNSPKL